MPTATPIQISGDELATVVYDDHGLVPAIAQDLATGEVLMMA